MLWTKIRKWIAYLWQHKHGCKHGFIMNFQRECLAKKSEFQWQVFVLSYHWEHPQNPHQELAWVLAQTQLKDSVHSSCSLFSSLPLCIKINKTSVQCLWKKLEQDVDRVCASDIMVGDKDRSTTWLWRELLIRVPNC